MPKQKRKRSPREVIESEKDPKVEHSYTKIPGRELMNVGFKGYEDRVWINPFKRMMAMIKAKRYTDVHTHPTSPGEYMLPSDADFNDFLLSNRKKTMVVAQQNPDTGKLEGYYVVRKTKKTESYSLMKDIKNRGGVRDKIDEDTLKYRELVAKNQPKRALGGIAKKYNLKLKFLPGEEYTIDAKTLNFVERETNKERGLESKIAAIIGLSLIVSILFTSYNITGFVVGNLSNKTSSMIGLVLFIIGIVGMYFYFKKK